MTWRMKHAYPVLAESQNGVGLVKAIDRRLRRHVEPEHPALVGDVFV